MAHFPLFWNLQTQTKRNIPALFHNGHSTALRTSFSAVHPPPPTVPPLPLWPREVLSSRFHGPNSSPVAEILWPMVGGSSLCLQRCSANYVPFQKKKPPPFDSDDNFGAPWWVFHTESTVLTQSTTQGSYAASLSAPFATSQFVLAAHYDFSIKSWLLKNI